MAIGVVPALQPIQSGLQIHLPTSGQRSPERLWRDESHLLHYKGVRQRQQSVETAIGANSNRNDGRLITSIDV